MSVKYKNNDLIHDVAGADAVMKTKQYIRDQFYVAPFTVLTKLPYTCLYDGYLIFTSTNANYFWYVNGVIRMKCCYAGMPSTKYQTYMMPFSKGDILTCNYAMDNVGRVPPLIGYFTKRDYSQRGV